MKSKNGNPSTVRHTIKIILRGIKEPFFYEVSVTEKDRIARHLRELDSEEKKSIDKTFIVFETHDTKLHVMVRVGDMQIIHFLWDSQDHQDTDKPEKGEENLRVYLRGRKEPFEDSIEEPVDAATLVTGLDSEPGYFEKFWTFLDVDGEEVAIQVDEIMLAEVSSDLVNEGHKELGLGEKPE